MPKRYTYSFVKTVTGKVTVTANSDDEAEDKARELVEDLNENDAAYEEETAEATMLDFKEAEPDGDDRDDDH